MKKRKRGEEESLLMETKQIQSKQYKYLCKLVEQKSLLTNNNLKCRWTQLLNLKIETGRPDSKIFPFVFDAHKKHTWTTKALKDFSDRWNKILCTKGKENYAGVAILIPTKVKMLESV